MYRTVLFSLVEKENLTDIMIFSGPPGLNSKCTINQVFNLYDPLESIPLAKSEIQKNFLPASDKNDTETTIEITKP